MPVKKAPTKKPAAKAAKTTKAAVKAAARKAPAAKAPAKKAAIAKGASMSCEVCGLVVTVDEACGCAEAHEIICCGEAMKPARKIKVR
jgi:hypothetical protein